MGGGKKIWTERERISTAKENKRRNAGRGRRIRTFTMCATIFVGLNTREREKKTVRRMNRER